MRDEQRETEAVFTDTRPEQRSLIRRIPDERRAAALLFLIVLGAYAYFFNGGGWNQNAQFALTRSIVERGRLDITGYPGSEDVGYIGGLVYANKLPGPSLMALVPYGVLHIVEGWLGIDSSSARVLSFNAYVCTVLVCAMPGALAAMALFLYGTRAAGRTVGWSALIALLVAFGTPMFAYSSMFIRHVPTGAFLLCAYVLSSRPIGRPLLAGVSAGVAGLCSYLAMPVIALLAIRCVIDSGWKAAGRFIAGGVPLAIVLAWFQLATTSSLFTIAAAQNERFTTEGAVLGFLGCPSFEVLQAILVSEHKGILFLSPLLLMVLPGLVRMIQHRNWAATLVVGGTILWMLAFNMSFNGWHGGWSIGSRYLIEGLPIAVTALLHLPRRRVVTAILLFLAAVSVVLNFVAVAVDPQPPFEVSYPFRDYLFPVLADGIPWAAPGESAVADHVNVNPVGLDGSLSRSSSFNLGELVTGSGRPLSLVPVLLWMLAGLALVANWAVHERRDA